MSAIIGENRSDAPVISSIMLQPMLGAAIDILPQLVSFTINETMFFYCLTGHITISDSINLFDQLPISGNEKLTIKFKAWDYSEDNRPCDFFHRTFDILKITDIKSENDFTKQYTIHFASPELKMNETIKISKSFPNTTISSVIAAIMTGDYDNEENEPSGLSFPIEPLAEDTKFLRSRFISNYETEINSQKVDENDSVELFIEKTKYIEPYITIPYSRPFEIITNLAKRAIRLTGGRYGKSDGETSANFMFFENKRGYQFISLDSLLENKVDSTTVFKFGNHMPHATGDLIERLTFPELYNVLKNINTGVYSSRLLTYDMATGEIKETDFDYLDNFYKKETISRDDTAKAGISDYPPIFLDKDNKNPITTKFLSKHMLSIVSPTHGIDNIVSDQTQRINENKEHVGVQEYLQTRLSQLRQLGDIALNIEIKGNSKHKVGDVVYVDLTSMPMEGIYRQMKYYSGYYLITRIAHKVTPSEYTMTLDIVKDSMSEKIGEK